MAALLDALERALVALRACVGAPVAGHSHNPLPALKHDSVLTTVGRTPLIKLQRMAPADVNVYVKVEAFNPGGP